MHRNIITMSCLVVLAISVAGATEPDQDADHHVRATAADYAAVEWYLARLQSVSIQVLDVDGRNVDELTASLQRALEEIWVEFPMLKGNDFQDCPNCSRRCPGNLCVQKGEPCIRPGDDVPEPPVPDAGG